jgi:type II secretory pathway pseudopilin PulG
MCTCFPPCRRCGAFTLVELLTTIGVIAILAGLMLPVLSAAREQAHRTQCLSNLRQLGVAFTMYLNDNRGAFPRPAQSMVPLPEDWIHYQPDRKLEEGALARYASQPFNPSIYRCPTDDIESHLTVTDLFGRRIRYDYSYSVNEMICRIGGRGQTLRINQIRNASEKILLIDESSVTIDDGCWAWQSSLGAGLNSLSNRHGTRSASERTESLVGHGNVAFVDGRAEYFLREEAYEQRHYDPKWR